MSAPPERCPLCRRPSAAPHAPFCSAACRDRDLLAWLDERYVLPGPTAADAGDEAGAPRPGD
ncbi:DNA gyrase inhibitor YacG [Thermaurantiacus sp.]